MLHNCTQCDYKSKVKCNVQRHMRTQHKSYSKQEDVMLFCHGISPCIQIHSIPLQFQEDFRKFHSRWLDFQPPRTI